MLITYTRAKQIIWHPEGLKGPWGEDIARQAAEQMVSNVYAVKADVERAKFILMQTRCPRCGDPSPGRHHHLICS